MAIITNNILLKFFLPHCCYISYVVYTVFLGKKLTETTMEKLALIYCALFMLEQTTVGRQVRICHNILMN